MNDKNTETIYGFIIVVAIILMAASIYFANTKYFWPLLTSGVSIFAIIVVFIIK